MRYSVRMKMLSGFFVVVLMLLLIGGTSLMRMNSMGEALNEMKDKTVPVVTLLIKMNGDTSDVERLALDIIFEANPDILQNLQSSYQSLLKEVESDQKELEPLLKSEESKKLFTDFQTSYKLYTDKSPAVLKAGLDDNFDLASQLHIETYKLWNTANDAITSLIQNETQMSQLKAENAVSEYEQGKQIILVVGIASIAAAILISFFISQTISSPIKRLSQSAARIADGDLTGEENKVKGRDEIADLTSVFNKMVHNLRFLLISVNETTESVAASSQQLNASAEQNSSAAQQISTVVAEVAGGSEEQVNIVEKTTQSVNEMVHGLTYISERAQNVSESAQGAYAKSIEGNQQIQAAVNRMESVYESVETLEQLMSRLDKRSTDIGNIVHVITNLANQTNLLALNAAIEAAHAGEHGLGFAVVAAEVRKLAAQSSLSAQKITEIIQDVQRDTTQALEAVGSNGRAIASGLNSVQEAGVSFEEILETVNKVAGEIEEVSAGSQQLSASSDELVRYAGKIQSIAETAASSTEEASAATEEQLASMQEIASSAEHLSMMAEYLQQQVSKFKI